MANSIDYYSQDDFNRKFYKVEEKFIIGEEIRSRYRDSLGNVHEEKVPVYGYRTVWKKREEESNNTLIDKINNLVGYSTEIMKNIASVALRQN